MDMTTFALDFAAVLLVAVGLAHSYLGERYVLQRLFRKVAFETIFRKPVFIRRTLRFAWHLTSVAWWGFAALLVILAHGSLQPADVALVTSITFLVHGAITLLCSGGRHLAWIVFLAIGALAWYASSSGDLTAPNNDVSQSAAQGKRAGAESI